MGSGLEDMQVGCLWQGEHILTVSLSGFINYLDLADPSKPKRILKVSDSTNLPNSRYIFFLVFLQLKSKMTNH